MNINNNKKQSYRLKESLTIFTKSEINKVGKKQDN